LNASSATKTNEPLPAARLPARPHTSLPERESRAASVPHDEPVPNLQIPLSLEQQIAAAIARVNGYRPESNAEGDGKVANVTALTGNRAS